MSSLKIVQVLPSLVVGGAETFATQLAHAQHTLGHEVHLLVLKDGGPLLERLSPEVRAHTTFIGKRHRWDATVLPRAARFLRTIRPDVVHTHLFTSLSWGTTAARLARVPVVLHTQHACHDDEYAYLPPVRRALSFGVDAVVGCSEAVVRDVHRRNYAPHADVFCIENGIPVHDRPRATLDHAPLRVGTVGRMVEIKGQRYLVRAVQQAVEAGADVHLTLVGDGPLRGELTEQVRAAGLEDRVTFTGQVSDVPARMASLDLFVLPSISEALPMTLLEAGAAGLPMLVTTGGGGPTLLEAGAGGWAVPPRDAASLAQVILDYARMHTSERARLGAASHDLVVSSYSLDRTAQRYVDAYRRYLPA